MESVIWFVRSSTFGRLRAGASRAKDTFIAGIDARKYRLSTRMMSRPEIVVRDRHTDLHDAAADRGEVGRVRQPLLGLVDELAAHAPKVLSIQA